MSIFSTSAILIRRTEYGDDDLIVSLLSPDHGRISLIAKHAKKSVRRFAGVLELFSMLQIVGKNGRGKLPVLQEAYLEHPFVNIRGNLKKTAYAGYWAEIMNEWRETDENHARLFELFENTLRALDLDQTPEEILSILFLMRFADMAGIMPEFSRCIVCGNNLEKLGQRFEFDCSRGSIVCENCIDLNSGHIHISKGSIKQLQWIATCDPERASRLKFHQQSLEECLNLMETFISYHLGKRPRSLTFLMQIRDGKI